MTGRGMTGARPASAASAPAGGGAGRPLPGAGLTHAVFFYRADEDGRDLGAMLRRATGQSSPLHLAVPDETMRLIGKHWRPPSGSRLVDMTELGRNPARIISAGQSFAEQLP